MTVEERLEALARPDKWFLACGDGIVWAPPFPQWLHSPGLWDEATIYEQTLGPLFSVALLSPDGRELALRQRERRWRPDGLCVSWETDAGARLEERRCALPGGRLVSAWRPAESWRGSGAAFLVAFTAQPGEEVAEGSVSACSEGIAFGRRLVHARGSRMEVRAELCLEADEPSPGAVRRAALRSEGRVARPLWALTPFPETWQPEGLREELRLEGLSSAGFVYLAGSLPLAAGAAEVRASIRLVPTLREAEPAAEGAGAQEAFGAEGGRAASRARAASHPRDAWGAFFDRFPRFRCSNPFLERYYDYRLYGLRLNRLDGGAGHVRHPAIAEGIGAFHEPIAYSAPCHMREMRWAADPAEARGSLLNFADAQKPDGSFHGRLHTASLERTDFYHASWGDAVLACEASHPDAAFLARAFDALARYAGWLDATRDPEGSGLYAVIDQYETGQEYMPRYLAVDASADTYGWENRIRLKGVDVTVYAYELKRALAVMARRLGRNGAEVWEEGARRIGRALVERTWDEEGGFFHDVDPRTGERTRPKAAVGFYPLLTDVLEPRHVSRLLAHLADPRAFATPFPVPSSSADDPLFSATAEWKGKRHACPWNGRVWPMTNSHVLEGLVRQWQRGRREAGPPAGRLLERFVRMMFHDGDPSRPNCHEHYNPLTGRASVYRGVDDYMHSWVNDLLIRGLTGVEPVLGGLRIDPLPMDVEHASLAGAHVAGRPLSVTRSGDALRVEIAGERHETRVGEPLELRF